MISNGLDGHHVIPSRVIWIVADLETVVNDVVEKVKDGALDIGIAQVVKAIASTSAYITRAIMTPAHPNTADWGHGNVLSFLTMWRPRSRRFVKHGIGWTLGHLLRMEAFTSSSLMISSIISAILLGYVLYRLDLFVLVALSKLFTIKVKVLTPV